jgi:hypothetical protein
MHTKTKADLLTFVGPRKNTNGGPHTKYINICKFQIKITNWLGKYIPLSHFNNIYSLHQNVVV